ncbi:SurA N-terminal domain-containing protein [Pedobacter sp. UYP30]|uniref:peptidylprolyl isomerase n=1 Tax=Pedobacter sp. UYP30 TaxID=1756400 RepID=UPI003391CAB9
MSFLRNRMGYILVFAIGFATVAFFIGDAITTGKPFWAENQKTVGTIDGVKVNIDDFGPKVDQSLNQFKQQYGNNVNPQMTAMAVDQAWNQEMASVLLNKEYERTGLTVSDDELLDLLQGSNPSPLIKQYFSNPQTGQLDRASLMNFLKSKDPGAINQSNLLQQEVKNQALQAKYSNLIRNSIYVTSLEATDEYNNRNKLANFKFVGLDYTSIPDASVKLTDEDYNTYYNEHKEGFDNPQETRSFEYVSFDIAPTSTDSAAVKKQVSKIYSEFQSAPNDSLFAAINSDVKVPYTYITKGKLDPAIDSSIFALPAGSFYGPKLIGNSYKMAKVIDTRFSPDSVKAAHILLDPAKLGGEDQAMKLADSLKTLIQKGGDFAALAKEYSVDGSKDKGGELGTFSRGAMVAEFEDAAFNGKPGDLKIVKSQFGIHILKIEKQMGSQKVVKVAYIEKALDPSSKTRDAAYKAASTFLTDVKGKDFAKYAKQKNLKVAVADKVTAVQGFAPNLDNPRKVIQAAFAADKGDVLPEIYNMTNAFVIAHLTDVKPKGILPLEDVKKEIEPMVMAATKGKMLADKFNKAGTESLDQIASKVGSKVEPVQNIVFANPVLPGVAQEAALVGSVFGTQPGKVSQPIIGDKGVYMFNVDGFTNPAPIANMIQQKQALLQTVTQRSLGAAFKALQDDAKIKDNRVKFY